MAPTKGSASGVADAFLSCHWGGGLFKDRVFGTFVPGFGRQALNQSIGGHECVGTLAPTAPTTTAKSTGKQFVRLQYRLSAARS
mmetsp:Transcript_34908/g.62390  ORF Transcript_34908/g.62390 Transcript_34908/m.62390 type:complete len:84 (+) Transcript_34908:1312-1563(+)